MINAVVLVMLVLAVIVPAKAAITFLGTRRIRVYHLRSVFERVSVPLALNQRISSIDDRLDGHRSKISKGVDCITAIEFIDDHDGERIMNRFDNVSSSLFLENLSSRLGFALGTALILAPLFIGAMALVPPFSKLIPLVKYNDPMGMMVIVAGAAFFGVLASMLTCLYVWRINFKKDVDRVLLVAGEQLLWETGKERRPGGRAFIEPSKDAAYSSLSK